jgi:dGTPase
MGKMRWNELLTSEKLHVSSIRVNNDNDRSEFERDHNKIIFSPFFRMLQNKTQLFPRPNNDFIHSRLTHTLEVSSVGKSIANLVAKNIIEKKLDDNLPNSFQKDLADIVSSACLLHDIGNPPFGHAGEDAISAFFSNNQEALLKFIPKKVINQLAHFDGNAEVIRLINQSRNLNLTFATIASVIKYPTQLNQDSIYKNKHSIFYLDSKLLENIAHKCGLLKLADGLYARHPLVFLVESADDICYKLLDLEDAHKMSLISFDDAYNLLMPIIRSNKKDISYIENILNGLTIEDKFAKLRSYTLNILVGYMVDIFIKNYDDIMSGNYKNFIHDGKLIGLLDVLMKEKSLVSNALITITNHIKRFVYAYNPVVEVELAGYEIISYLLDQFVFAIIEFAENNISKRSIRILQLLPERYNQHTSDISEMIFQVTDYISSLTDQMAINLYRKLKGVLVS